MALDWAVVSDGKGISVRVDLWVKINIDKRCPASAETDGQVGQVTDCIA